MRVGNKQNAFLNGEWGKHGPKKEAARKRRGMDKKEVRNQLLESVKK